MDCIENSPFPLVFKLDGALPVELSANQHGRRLQLRTATRALAGMQKEALVNYGPTGTNWRVVCDEGRHFRWDFSPRAWSRPICLSL